MILCLIRRSASIIESNRFDQMRQFDSIMRIAPPRAARKERAPHAQNATVPAPAARMTG